MLFALIPRLAENGVARLRSNGRRERGIRLPGARIAVGRDRLQDFIHWKDADPKLIGNETGKFSANFDKIAGRIEKPGRSDGPGRLSVVQATAWWPEKL